MTPTTSSDLVAEAVAFCEALTRPNAYIATMTQEEILGELLMMQLARTRLRMDGAIVSPWHPVSRRIEALQRYAGVA